MKSRVLIRLLKETLTVDQEPTLFPTAQICQQTRRNRKVKYSGNSSVRTEERWPPPGQTETKHQGRRGAFKVLTQYLPSCALLLVSDDATALTPHGPKFRGRHLDLSGMTSLLRDLTEGG